MDLNFDFQSDIALMSYSLAAVLLGALISQFLLIRLLGTLDKKVDQSANELDDLMLSSLRKPALALVWLVAVSWMVHIAGSQFFELRGEIIDTIRDTFIILFSSWSIFRVIDALEKFWLLKANSINSRLDGATLHAIGKLFKLITVCMTVLILMQYYGFSISGILAFGGVGGVAVGFAAKDLLANFFGALMIFLDRPFSIGDWVRSPDHEIEGTIEHIGWRVTTIRTFDKRPLYVPNSLFTTIVVENPSRMSNRRIYETVGLRYKDAAKMKKIVADVKEMLSSHEAIDQNLIMIVNFNAFNASSLDFFIYTFTKTVDWLEFHEIKQDVMLKVVEIVHANEADFAFPTTTLNVEAGESVQEVLPVDPISNEK